MSHPPSFLIGILHLKPTILFQISLESWLKAMPIATNIETLTKEIQSSERILTPRKIKNRLQQIEHSIALLIGTTHNGAAWELGPPPLLPRLSEGIWRLIENKRYVMETTLSLYNAINQAVESARRCTTEKPLNQAPLRLVTSLHKVGAALMDSLSLFRDDENILFYLLRHHQVIDQAIVQCSRTPTVAKSLQKLYPEGLTTLEKHLKQRFTRRGFSEVIPSIQDALTTIAPPCLTNSFKN